MRVLHVTPYFAPAFQYGGPPRSVLGLCRALQQSGVEVEVYTTTANGSDPELPPAMQTPVLCQDVPTRYFPLRPPRRFFCSRMASQLSRSLSSFDLVHIHTLWNLVSWPAAAAARRAHVPYVISPRGMLEGAARAHRRWRKRFAYPLIERHNLRHAALLHATSEVERNTLGQLGLDVPICMLPNGIERLTDRKALRNRFRQRLQLPADVPLIAWIGRIHPIKRLDLLASAFTQVWAVLPHAHLVIAGPDENHYRARVQPLFRAVAKNVHWVGALESDGKQALLADANALVVCSDTESFAMVVVEALAAGVPTVVTRNSPWQKMETARCGYWTEHEPQAIVAALLEVLTHPEMAASMGERAQQLVKSEFLWSSIAAGMTQQYSTVLEQFRGRRVVA